MAVEMVEVEGADEVTVMMKDEMAMNGCVSTANIVSRPSGDDA